MSQGKRMKKEESKKRKHSKGTGVFLKTVAFIYIVLTIVFCYSIFKMNLLPATVIAIFTGIEAVLTLFLLIGLLKKHKTYKLTVFCTIIILLLSGIYIYATNYALATSDFLGNVFQVGKETEEYYVVVRKDSTYSKVDDIKNENINVFQLEEEIQAKIKDKVNTKFVNQENLYDLGTKLLSKDINVIAVSSAQYNMLSDNSKDFVENTKIIYTLEHEIQTNTELENTNSKYTVNSGKFNLYISGIDTSGKITNVSRSDANTLITVNTNTHEMLMTSLPRDYYVTLHSKKAKDKLTHSGIYGINETVTTVEDLFNTDINYYVRVNFTTVIKLIDKLGGVSVYSDYDFTTSDGKYHFNKGYNFMNGEEALRFSRERYNFASGDNQRIVNQQHVIEAVMKKVLNSTTILTKYTSILDGLTGSFQTNIEQDEISKIVKDQISNMASWKIESNTVTGTGATSSTYSMGSTPLYVMVPDSTSVSNAKTKIQKLLDK